MAGIIVTGHGNFGTGLLSSMKLIAGEQENVFAIDFTENDSTETLEVKLKEAINKINSDILVLSDLAGGSPFRVSVLLKNEFSGKNIEVIAGTNLPMLLETALMKDGMEVIDLRDFALNSGKDGVVTFAEREKSTVEDDCDGI